MNTSIDSYIFIHFYMLDKASVINLTDVLAL